VREQNEEGKEKGKKNVSVGSTGERRTYFFTDSFLHCGNERQETHQIKRTYVTLHKIEL
jgi:hypothetical protein